MATIKARHPVRAEFSGCSSGNRYYDDKSHALDAFDEVLAEHHFYMSYPSCVDMSGDSGRVTLEVFVDPNGPFENPDGPERVGYAHFTWYKMCSGRWEVIGYLS